MVLHALDHVQPGVDLRLAQVGVLVEVLEGGLHGRLQVVEEPDVLGDVGQAVGAGGPRRDAPRPERLAEHVLVHVEDHEDAVPLRTVHGRHDLVEVRLVELALGRLEVIPEHDEPHVVHAPGGGIGQELVAGVGGRVAGLHVEAVELEGAALVVGDVHPTVGALGRRPPGDGTGGLRARRCGHGPRRRGPGRRRGGRLPRPSVVVHARRRGRGVSPAPPSPATIRCMPGSLGHGCTHPRPDPAGSQGAAARPPRRRPPPVDGRRAGTRRRPHAPHHRRRRAGPVVHAGRLPSRPRALPRDVRPHGRRHADQGRRSCGSPPSAPRTSRTTASSTPRSASPPSCTSTAA